MRLISFNIQNYRSIIHSGWCNLAHDNITALIGQNESGKTSVLEALYSFYEGQINEDVLRSDMSLPSVSCKFELENRTLAEYLDLNLAPKGLQELLKTSRMFVLCRSWRTDRTSHLFLATDEILNYYEKKEIEWAGIKERTHAEIHKLLQVSEKIFNEMETAERLKEESRENLGAAQKKLETDRKLLKRARKPDEKLVAEKDFDISQKNYASAEEDYRLKVESFEQNKLKTQELSEKVSVCKACNGAVQNVEESNEMFLKHKSFLKELEHQFEIASGEKDQKTAYNKIQQLKNELIVIEKKYIEAVKQENLLTRVAEKVLSGKSYKSALSEAESDIAEEVGLYNIYSMGEILKDSIPVFEFFEDFSSLLPNKIDLEDILN